MRRLARLLLYAGTLLIVIGLGKYHARYIGHYVFHDSSRLPWSLALAAFLSVAAYGLGLPDLEKRRSAWAPSVGAALSAAGAISLFQLVLGSQLLPRFVLFASAVAAVPWYVVCSRVADVGRSRQEGRDRVVLVGRSEEQSALRTEVDRPLERSMSVVAALLPSEAASAKPSSRPLVEAVIAHRGTLVVLDRAAGLDDSIVAQAASLHESGVRVRSLAAFYDEWLGKLPISELERMSLMFDVGELHRLRYGRMKRLCDVGVGVLGLLALVVSLPPVVIGNVIANRGPLLYRQPRVGRANQEFQILKLRTMIPGHAQSNWTAEDDRRITRFGRLLRRSHIDELPQVINILRGDQSVVGPRPEQPGYVAELRGKIPFYDLRHLVRPGLTGWAQVKYQYGSTELDALEKLQYDFYYLRHQSLTLDMRIIGRTIRSVIGRLGR